MFRWHGDSERKIYNIGCPRVLLLNILVSISDISNSSDLASIDPRKVCHAHLHKTLYRDTVKALLLPQRSSHAFSLYVNGFVKAEAAVA